jgi:hypothetical protein
MEETTRRSFLRGLGTVLGAVGLGAGVTQVIAKPQPVVDDTTLVVEATRLLYRHHYQGISATTTNGKTILFTDDPNTWMNTTMVIHDGACGIAVYSRDRRLVHTRRATMENLEETYRDMCLYAFHNFA